MLKRTCLGLWVIFFLLLIILVTGCTPSSVKPSPVDMESKEQEGGGYTGMVQVVATIFPLVDIIRNVGGPLVEVTTLLPAGSSPHTYEPTVEQVKKVSGADLFVYIGGGLDDWAVKLAAAAEDVLLVEVIKHIGEYILPYEPIRLDRSFQDTEHVYHHGHEENHQDEEGIEALAGEESQEEHYHEHHHHGPEDPHVWLDPLLVRDIIAPLVAEKLVKVDPENARYYRDNLARFQQSLDELHEEISRAVEKCKQRKFISYHSAWNYFAGRYGLEEVAAVEEFPGKEPSARWLAELVKLARDNNIKVIFAEPQLGTRAAEVIAREIDGYVLFLDPLGGETVPGRDSYLGLMRYNLRVFQEALLE